LNALVRPSISKLKPYSSARDEFQGDSAVFLDANESPFETGVNRYPDPLQRALKQRIAAIKGVDADRIFLGNGSDEVLDLIFRAYCEPGQDNVIILPPTYGMYRVLADLNGVECREVLLTSDFGPDVEKIQRMVDSHSKVLFLCSPNNPSGNAFDQGKMEHLLRSFSGLVVVDEAYVDFCIERTLLPHLAEFPNLIVTQTFSKAYGLAGIRLGMAFASAEIISVLNRIKPPYNINNLTQRFAFDRLADTSPVEQQVNRLLEERKKLSVALTTVPWVKEVFPSDANFLLIRVDDADLRYRQLVEHGIVVRNRSSQPLCENCLRITVGTEEENTRLLQVMKELCA
jgi:histidinol-phosphate aminotransferase